MKLMLFSARGSADRLWLERTLAPLEGEDLDVVLVMLHRPVEKLPVRRCIVLRPYIRPRRKVLDIAVEGHDGQPEPTGQRARVLNAIDRRIREKAPARIGRNRPWMVRSGAVPSRAVREEFEQADFVVAADAPVAWAVWKLAKAFPKPQVVFGVEGIVRKRRELAFAAGEV